MSKPFNWITFAIYSMAILVFFLKNASLQANDEDMIQAETYVQAENFNQGRIIYEKLLKSTNESWKKVILQYNLATLELLAENYDQAISLFKEILTQETLPSLMLAPVHANLGIAYWRSIQKRSLNLENFESLITSYLSLIATLETALEEIILAEAFYCQLILEEGGEHCEKEENLFLLKSSIQNHITAIKQEFQKKQIQTISLIDSLPLILNLFNLLKNNLEDLLSIPSPSHNLLKNQITKIKNQLISWNILWDSLNEKNSQNSFISSLKKAYSSFFNDLENLQLKQAIEKIEFIQKTALETLYSLYSSIPTPQLLNYLLRNFQNLTSFNLNTERVLILIQQEKLIKNILELRDSSFSSLDNSLDFLESSLQNLETNHLEDSKANFLLAYKKISRLVYELNISSEIHSLKNIDFFLQQLIEEQQINLLIFQLFKKIQKNELSLQANQETVEFAQNFWNLVFKVQTENFKKSCQFQPWNEVIPLFEKGFNWAKKENYEKSLLFWGKALNKLLTPTTNTSCENNFLSSPPTPPSQKKSSWNSSIENVLHTLQMMEKKDLRPPSQPKEGIIQEKLW